MDIFNVLTMVGGLCLFLFGMNVMGQALERTAGGKLESLLGRLTGSKAAGFFTGLGVTAVIQSSSATTVMVVGFVNSGLMGLRQAIHVIMGANVGTTVTAWILSLGGISGDSLWVQLLKPSSFTPVLALIGICLYMFAKSDRKKESGTILLGFAVLMFGMDTMTGAVSGLAQIPAFQKLFLLFTNPFLGVLVGALLTAVIQSSSASVGILQALAATGQVTYGAAVPIIMGQNIGTCVTALLSSFGTNRNAKRAAVVHLSFNVVGTAIWLTAFSLIKYTLAPALFGEAASLTGIAVAHSLFNIGCTLLLLPAAGLLEKLAYKLVPETEKPEKVEELDERLLATPTLAMERSHALTVEMAESAVDSMNLAMGCLWDYTPEKAAKIRAEEERTDHWEDVLSSYLVKLSAQPLNAEESARAAMLLKLLGDFERISDHAVNVVEAAEELRKKKMTLTDSAYEELRVLTAAVGEILHLSLEAFLTEDPAVIRSVEPLEQVIDSLKEQLRINHIQRLQQGGCTVEAGFVWADLLTGLERTSDHCSNIAGCVLDRIRHNMNIHQNVRAMKAEEGAFRDAYETYAQKYALT